MYIRQIKIRNFKSLKEFDIEDIPDMVVLAGPNGVGKSSVLQAIVYLIAPYTPHSIPQVIYNWRPKVVSAGEDFAEIACVIKIAPEEVSYLESIGQKDIQNEGQVHVKLDKNGERIESNATAGLATLLQTDDREKYPNIGIFDYMDAHRLFPSHAVEKITLFS